LQQRPTARNSDSVVAKTGNTYFGSYDRQHQNSSGKCSIFDHDELDKKCSNDCSNDGQPEMARLAPKCLYCHFQLSVVVAVIWDNFFKFGVIKNPRFAFGMLIVYVTVPDILIFPVLAVTLPFPVIIVVTITWQHFYQSWHGRKCLVCCWNYGGVCHYLRDKSISGFGGHIAISGCRPVMQSLADTSLNSQWP